MASRVTHLYTTQGRSQSLASCPVVGDPVSVPRPRYWLGTERTARGKHINTSLRFNTDNIRTACTSEIKIRKALASWLGLAADWGVSHTVHNQSGGLTFMNWFGVTTVELCSVPSCYLTSRGLRATCRFSYRSVWNVPWYWACSGTLVLLSGRRKPGQYCFPPLVNIACPPAVAVPLSVVLLSLAAIAHDYCRTCLHSYNPRLYFGTVSIAHVLLILCLLLCWENICWLPVLLSRVLIR